MSPAAEKAVNGSEELQVHFNAYLQLFQAVLNKKALPAERSRQILQEMRRYLAENIQTTDAFIQHIPFFAQKLGVNEGALASFIGSNFLKALSLARQQIAKTGPAPAPAPAASGPVAKTPLKSAKFFDELAFYCESSLKKPDRFISMDGGLMKMVLGGREIYPVSLKKYPDLFSVFLTPGAAIPEETAPISTETAPIPVGSPKQSGQTTVTGKIPERTASSRRSPFPERDTSILQEILDKFGSVLDVHTKLVVSAFPEGMDVSQEDASGEEEPSGEEGAVTPLKIERPAGAPVVSPEAQVRRRPQMAERPILQEIMERFGSTLKITGKLVPSSGLDGGENGMDSGPTSRSGATESGGAAIPSNFIDTEIRGEALPPIQVSLLQYLDVIKKLQDFQGKGDRLGYQEWYYSSGREVRSLVSIRNLDLRARKGEVVVWDAEYGKLSGLLEVPVSELKTLRNTIRRYEGLSTLINSLASEVRGKPPSILQWVRKIWPQIKLLFNEESDYESLKSQLKIILLQIPDPEMKVAIQSLLDPYLRKAAVLLMEEIGL